MTDAFKGLDPGAAIKESSFNCPSCGRHDFGLWRGSTMDACRAHVTRTEAAEAELSAARTSYEATAANLTKTTSELFALRQAAEDFLGWQNGLPLETYDPPFTVEGQGYTASLKRLEALLSDCPRGPGCGHETLPKCLGCVPGQGMDIHYANCETAMNGA